MSVYSVSEGVDVDLVDLLPIDPQPKSAGVQYLRRAHSASGAAVDQGAFVELEFTVLETPTVYADLLAQFGLGGFITRPVTILCRDEFWTFQKFNGIACRPESGKDTSYSYFPSKIIILIRNLEGPLVEA